MNEHDVVRLKIDAYYNARRNVIPKGTMGTVVHVHELMTEGRAVKGQVIPVTRIMEVEFPEHKQVLAINELWLEVQ
jgi:hypothetical protein